MNERNDSSNLELCKSKCEYEIRMLKSCRNLCSYNLKNSICTPICEELKQIQLDCEDLKKSLITRCNEYSTDEDCKEYNTNPSLFVDKCIDKNDIEKVCINNCTEKFKTESTCIDLFK